MSFAGREFGHVVDGEGGSVTELVRSGTLPSLIAEHGVVLLRNFRDGAEEFETVTDSLGAVRPANIRVGTTRQFESGNGTQAVNAGNLAVPLHAESYYTPISPQILAFTCVEFTTAGGETVFCDGVELFGRLDEDARTALRSASVEWRHECAVSDLETQTQMSVDRFRRWCDRADECSVTVDDTTGTVAIRYVAPAIRKTWWGAQESFANNLIPINQSGVLAEMSPGLAARHVEAAEREAAAITVAHRWQPRDVALIDNTRVMHGRNPWSGGVRHLQVRMLTVEADPD
ncbi:MAG TPA: TauD/TfdA family dioxygenase [Actinocatenispora sp.]